MGNAKSKEVPTSTDSHAQAKRSKPTPAQSAYQFFLAQAPSEEVAKFKERWRTLDEQERQRFDKMAKDDKQRYSQELEEWKKLEAQRALRKASSKGRTRH